MFDLINIQMPRPCGLEATRGFLQAHPEVKVLVVTVNDSEPYPSKQVRMGASGYLAKVTDIKKIPFV